MRIKGLAEATKLLREMQEHVEERIDENPHCVSTFKGEAIDEDLNQAWMELDTAIDALKEVAAIKVGDRS
jgi:hypothetical protein